MHGNVPVRFGRGRLDSLGNKGLAAYLITSLSNAGVKQQVLRRRMNGGEQLRGRDDQRPVTLAERRARRCAGRERTHRGTVPRDGTAGQGAAPAAPRATLDSANQREHVPRPLRVRTTSVGFAPVWRCGAVASGGCPASAAASVPVAPSA